LDASALRQSPKMTRRSESGLMPRLGDPARRTSETAATRARSVFPADGVGYRQQGFPYVSVPVVIPSGIRGNGKRPTAAPRRAGRAVHAFPACSRRR
jgi:hypothetical protein